MIRIYSICAILLTVLTFCSVLPAQKPADRPRPAETPDGRRSVKKNIREVSDARPSIPTPAAFTHIYLFDRPEFTVSRVEISHDDAGIGEVTFSLEAIDDPITDPIKLSAATLERIEGALARLNFLDSDENYQFEKDYPHLGTVRFTLDRNGKKRTVAFNWTIDPDAKLLMDEYRKIANQNIWVFRIGAARANQPLETPKLIVQLASYLKRGEISDPVQMIPFLTRLGDDESIPLVARNHALKLIKEIEKAAEKSMR